MASNIPKFASFRPKPKAAPEPPQEPREPEKAGASSKEKPHHVRKRSPSPKRPHRHRHVSPNKTYFSDRRGDSEVLRFGTLNSYDIPEYRRYGHGYVLGLSPGQKIDREHSTGKKIYLTPATRRRQERLLTNRHANKSSGRALRLIKVGESGADVGQDFIPVSATGKTRPDDGDEETSELDYRGLDDNRNLTEPADPDTQYESDTGIGIDAEVTRKNSELVRRTREHPGDLQAWLALIDHQEAMLKLDRPSAELTTSDKGHLADVRIATYEEALKKIGMDQDSHLKLYEGLLNEAQRAWDDTKLSSKWKEVLSKHPHSICLWFMYLNFVQSNFTRFKYEDCRSTFFSCLDALRTNSSGNTPATNLHLLLRLTSMMQTAGYQELALAIWQALLEFYMMRPATDANNHTFEEFWESEVPRIGEPEAKGWKRCGTVEAPPPGASPLQELNTSDSVFEGFRKREAEAMAKLRYPGRTSDDVGEDDAFHAIFFSDIEEYLKIIPLETPETLILEAFLCFGGLPPLPRPATHQQQWWSDPFLHRQFHPADHIIDEASQFMQTLRKFLDTPVKCFQMTSEHLFQQGFALHDAQLDADFIGRLLKLLATDLSSDEIIGEYLLAFELHHFPGQAQKTAKQLLKARPSSLRLYNAYGLVESHRCNSGKADQVFSMALSMQKGGTALSTIESLELFNNWVWEALYRGEKTEGFWRLASPHGNISGRTGPYMPPDEGSLLRARTVLSETSEHALLGHDYGSAILSTSLLALLAYLSNDCKVAIALETHQNLSIWFNSHKLSKSPWAELHAQAIARFLTQYSMHAPIVKPALIRTTLEPIISRFPNNTVLLSLYAANEARFSIDDRVRGIMHQIALQSSEKFSLVGWAFAIHYETLKGELAGSTSHSIRALYKRATDSTGTHCPALWISYLQFELGQLHQEQARRPKNNIRKDGKGGKWEGRVEEAEERVKETFYAGLRNIPWCKDYFLLAFTDAGEVFGEEDKWRLYRAMQEKELRLYVELDETED